MLILLNNIGVNIVEDLSKGKIIIYTSSDGSVSLDVKLENDTIWLTQKSMAELFGVKVPAINKHINNIYKEEELQKDSTISILEIVCFALGFFVPYLFNLYIELVALVKQSTQEYYNMRMALGLGCA